MWAKDVMRSKLPIRKTKDNISEQTIWRYELLYTQVSHVQTWENVLVVFTVCHGHLDSHFDSVGKPHNLFPNRAPTFVNPAVTRKCQILIGKTSTYVRDWSPFVWMIVNWGIKKLDDWVVTKCSPYLTMTQTTTLPIFFAQLTKHPAIHSTYVIRLTLLTAYFHSMGAVTSVYSKRKHATMLEVWVIETQSE